MYVKDLSSYFYANSADEEATDFSATIIPRQDQFSDAIGKVTSIEGRELTIGIGSTAMRVDTSRMADNPLDESGNKRVSVGDRIYAWGTLDIEPKERAEIMANGVIKLMPLLGPTGNDAGASTAAGSVSPSPALSPTSSPDSTGSPEGKGG